VIDWWWEEEGMGKGKGGGVQLVHYKEGISGLFPYDIRYFSSLYYRLYVFSISTYISYYYNNNMSAMVSKVEINVRQQYNISDWLTV